MATKARKNTNLNNKEISALALKENVKVDIYDLSTKDKIENTTPEVSNFFSSTSSEIYTTIPTISTNSSISNIPQAKLITKKSIRKKAGKEKTVAVTLSEISSKDEQKLQNNVLTIQSAKKKKNALPKLLTKSEEKSLKKMTNKSDIKNVREKDAKNKIQKKLVKKVINKKSKKNSEKKIKIINKVEISKKKGLEKAKFESNKHKNAAVIVKNVVPDKNLKKSKKSNLSTKCIEETKLPENPVTAVKRRCASAKSSESTVFKTLSNVSSRAKNRKSY